MIQIEENKTKPSETNNNFDFSHPNTYAALNKLRLTDLNNNPKSPTFYRYSKEDIIKYLKDPAKFEKQLRDAVIYMYGASSQFRRIIQYFVGLSDLSYILTPYKVDISSINQKTFKSQYFKSQNFIAQMDIKNQCPTMLTVALREDVYYCTTWITTDNITFQQLPSEVCKISTIEGNVPNVSFNFSYFDTNMNLLNFYPSEFTSKYNVYSSDRTQKWQELDSPNSFAIKCNKDILSYALPPLAAILINLYELSDYQLLKMTKTELENYALLVMTLGVDKEGHWLMPFDDAKQYWKNLAGELPNLIGSVLTPMPIEKIDFNKTGTAEVDKVAESESHLFSAAGVSSQLFSNDKASSSSLLLSIKADQAITFGIVKSIESALNRILQNQNFGKNFKLNILDCSPYNRQEVSEIYLKAAQSGIPTVSLYCASLGLTPSDMEGMNFIEDTMLDIKNKFKPLKTSSTLSSEESGRPTNASQGKGLDKTGEQTENDGENLNK